MEDQKKRVYDALDKLKIKYEVVEHEPVHTMEDMDRLLAEAKKRDIRIIMDLVVNHCSDQHEWFKKAIEDPYGPYGKYFYILEGRDGKVPCNWRSYFGGSVWDKLPGHDNLYYLHMFAKEQPDLNWENPLLREEIYRMIRWWLEREWQASAWTRLSTLKRICGLKISPPTGRTGCAPAAKC